MDSLDVLGLESVVLLSLRVGSLDIVGLELPGVELLGLELSVVLLLVVVDGTVSRPLWLCEYDNPTAATKETAMAAPASDFDNFMVILRLRLDAHPRVIPF